MDTHHAWMPIFCWLSNFVGVTQFFLPPTACLTFSPFAGDGFLLQVVFFNLECWSQIGRLFHKCYDWKESIALDFDNKSSFMVVCNFFGEGSGGFSELQGSYLQISEFQIPSSSFRSSRFRSSKFRSSRFRSSRWSGAPTSQLTSLSVQEAVELWQTLQEQWFRNS